MVQGVYSEDVKQQLEATTQFRKLLSIGEFLTAADAHLPTSSCCLQSERACTAERNPPIEEVINQGVIPRFVQVPAAIGLPAATGMQQLDAAVNHLRLQPIPSNALTMVHGGCSLRQHGP